MKIFIAGTGSHTRGGAVSFLFHKVKKKLRTAELFHVQIFWVMPDSSAPEKHFSYRFNCVKAHLS